MPSFIYNAQVLEDEQGARWQVVRYSVDEGYVALVSLNGPRAVEVRALTDLLAAIHSGKVRHVLTVDRSGNPTGPRLNDLRRMPLSPSTSSVAEAPTRIRIDHAAGSRTSNAQLLGKGLSLFMQRRATARVRKA